MTRARSSRFASVLGLAVVLAAASGWPSRSHAQRLPDEDGDGIIDIRDNCPDVANRNQADRDGDGDGDVCDNCPADANANQSDRDGDGSGDGCPADPRKTAPGECGCGVPDTDSDRDGTLDCDDGCPDDPRKTAPGECGCGVPDTDSDRDGAPDCDDECPDDPRKTAPGECGCGVSDADSDRDGTPNCDDGCPDDPRKTAPGECGCGIQDTDTDSDGTADCDDGCPEDRTKTAPGECGCGVPDTDSDRDGAPNCTDNCPETANPDQADGDRDGLGDACDTVVVDSDDDGIPDAEDNCPKVANPDQFDGDDDGLGDACDEAAPDGDDDGIPDAEDNCPKVANPAQTDIDCDGLGDDCDTPLDPVLACPQLSESALAFGFARFNWENPAVYDSIEVQDVVGGVLAVLPGDATSIELPVGNRRELSVRVVGIAGEASAESAKGTAKVLHCDRPPPLIGDGTVGGRQFTIYGGPRVEPPGNGAAAGADGGFLDIDDIPPLNSVHQNPNTIGYVIPGDQSLLPVFPYRNKLRTGFVLEQASTKLEIAGYYEKTATAFGLELRGRLTLVHATGDPAEEGIIGEFVFPDILVTSSAGPCPAPGDGAAAGFPVPAELVYELTLDRGKQWNSAVFYRSTVDPGEADQPCEGAPDVPIPIPAGEYVLDIYSVNGDARLPYYVFGSEGGIGELLIPGAPCPPYPKVRVTDLDGVRTLPVVTEVHATPLRTNVDPSLDPIPLVRFDAIGEWLDEDGNCHSIMPGGTGFVETPEFEYVWTFLDFSPPLVKTTSTSSLCMKIDWGCYKIAVTVRDKPCGTAKRRVLEVPIVPFHVECTDDFQFLYPTPRPRDVWALVGLDPPPGIGEFQGRRSIQFRVLVVPPRSSRCEDDCCPGGCPAANLGTDICDPADDSVRFRLATNLGPNGRLDVDVLVEDLCSNITRGMKYLHVTVEDLGKIPGVPVHVLDPDGFADVHFQGRNAANLNWQNIAEPLHLANRPASLESSFWTGHYIEEDHSYHFAVKSDPNTETRFPAGETDPVNILDVTEIAPKDNDLSSGFTARYFMQSGLWFPDRGTLTSSGVVLDNMVDTDPFEVQGRSTLAAALAGGDGGGAALEDTTYDWCREEVLFENDILETLFEGPLWAGFAGPVWVELWARVQFGFSTCIKAYTSVFVHPFAAFLDGNNDPAVEAHAYLVSTAKVRIPARISASVAGGIVNISAGLRPEVSFLFDTHLESINLAVPGAQLFIESILEIYMFIEGCVDFVLFETCVEVDFPIVDPVTIISEGSCPPLYTCDDPAGNGTTCDPANRGCDSSGIFGLGGGAGVTELSVGQVVSGPSLDTHPDGTVAGSYMLPENHGVVFVGMNVVDPTQVVIDPQSIAGIYRDPAVAFISGPAAADAVLVAWTKLNFMDPLPAASVLNNDLSVRNQVTAAQDIMITPVVLEPAGWTVLLDDTYALSDDPALPGGTADGLAVMSSDLSGEAIVAWVRYETPDLLIVDPAMPTRTVRRRPGPDVPCAIQSPGGFCDDEIPNVRPQLELTAIYARRAGAQGPVGPKTKLSPAGVNIDPAVAHSPSGAVAYCVWVHHPTATNLLDDNTGRNIHYAVYDAALDSWSPSAPVLPQELAGDFPGLLTPDIALAGDADGTLVFTALKTFSPPILTGLGGGNRFVYISRLEGGVFGPPILVHGVCDSPVYGWNPTVVIGDEFKESGKELIIEQAPQALVAFQEFGRPGLSEGSGNWIAVAIGEGMTEPGPPVRLIAEENVYTNFDFAAGPRGDFHSLHLNMGPNLVDRAQGGGAGGGAELGYELETARIEPDLAVISCRLSQPFAAPGSLVRETVIVENQGLANSSTFTASGESAVGLRAVYVRQDGEEQVIATTVVPELAPGARAEVVLMLEMPLDPVRLRVELHPNPVDRNLENNWCESFFGCPPPRDLECGLVELRGVELPDVEPRALLQWTNPALYDEVLVYREDSLIAALPGSATTFVDQSYAGAVTDEGAAVEYAVRGRAGSSRSPRVTCSVGGTPEVAFVRGDANGDGSIDITDGIFTFGYLFLGGDTPGCLRAADANSSDAVDISDGIYVLGFLFNGGPEPGAPYPDCGAEAKDAGLACASQPRCR